MSIINLSNEAIGIQHAVPSGSDMTGILPANGDPTYSKDRHVLVYPAEAAAGGGLFVPSLIFSNDDDHAYCTQILLLASSGTFTYDVQLTSGFGDGDTTTIDAPAHDASLATGTTSNNVLLKPNVELLRGQGIRVEMNTGADDLYAIVYFALTLGEGGRLLS